MASDEKQNAVAVRENLNPTPKTCILSVLLVDTIRVMRASHVTCGGSSALLRHHSQIRSFFLATGGGRGVPRMS